MSTTINLSWPANPSSEGVYKYQLFESLNGGAFNFKADVTASANPSWQILNPSPGLYRWQVRAVNFVGNSVMSNAAVGPDVPTQPGDITVSIVNS